MKKIDSVAFLLSFACGFILYSCVSQPVVRGGGEAEAAEAAVRILRDWGTDSVLAVQTQRIEAPVAGYIVDLTGELLVGDAVFDIFRVGISEENGQPFVFFARGLTGKGHFVWLVRDKEGDFVVTEELPFSENEFLHWQKDSFDSLRDR